MKSILLSILIVLTLGPRPAWAEPEAYTQAQVVENLAESFGIDQWDQVEAIEFTFNVRKEDMRQYRTWTWHTKTNVVKYAGPMGERKLVEIEYDRDKLDEQTNEQVRQVDAMFINDSFWLLLPLHLKWSMDVKVEYTGYQRTPLKKSIAKQIIVTYPKAAGGYTPGDVYKLYVDDNWRIVQWSYHKAGADEPTLATIWAQDEQVGPLRLTTDFVNPQIKFQLWFTGVAVKTTGSESWVESKKLDHKCRTCP